MKIPEQFGKRLVMTTAGVALSGIAVGFFQASVFGVDPFQCFAQGLWNLFPGLGYGLFYALLNLVLLAVDFVLNRHYIGIATFINLFLVGYIVTFSKACIDAVVPLPNLPVRVLLLAIGVVIGCVAASLYYTSDLGVSTYDAIALTMGERKLIVGGHVIPFKYCRIATDIICVLIGFVCGAVVGVGTLISAFFTGPMVAFFNTHMAEPLLYGKK
jgi:uncharacterized membrane protein YczE